jgi:hypothetical protein
MADNFAYEITGSGSDLFGVVDLNTGMFTPVGNMGLTLAGLGSAKPVQDALGIETDDVVNFCFTRPRTRPANAGGVLA